MDDKTQITLIITEDQRAALITATRGNKELNLFNRRGFAVVTKDNIIPVRAAVVDLKSRSLNAKRKNIDTIQTSYSCERLIDKLDNILLQFGMEVPEDERPTEVEEVIAATPSLTKEVEEVNSSNENEPVVAAIPSLTKVEEKVEQVDGPVVESIPSATVSLEPKKPVNGPTVESTPSRTNTDEQDFDEPKEKPVVKKRTKRNKKDET